MIRAAVPAETSALVSLAVATGLFTPADADLLLRQTLDDLHGGHLGEGHHAVVWVDGEGGIGAWAYFAENPKANGVWDLWWIGVEPRLHGHGLGKELLAFVEGFIRERGGRLLVIETSSLSALSRTREFYRRRGYTECGTIPEFYGEGDGKVTFARTLV